MTHSDRLGGDDINEVRNIVRFTLLLTSSLGVGKKVSGYERKELLNHASTTSVSPAGSRLGERR